MEGLVLKDVKKTYLDLYAGEHVTALTDISVDLKPGEFVSIVGPSGCGKTTLLNIVAGFVPPSGGEVVLNGRRIQGPGRDRGVVFQNFALFPWKTVQDNVGFGLKMRGMAKAERQAKAAEYLELVGLAGFGNRYPHELSGGMQQRVGVARALANDPELLLMDEPFASIDAQTRMTLQEELSRICSERHPTVLFVTHDVDEAVFLSTRIIVLTPRPGTIRRVVDVDLPQPRTWTEVMKSPSYKELVAEVLGLVRSSGAAREVKEA